MEKKETNTANSAIIDLMRHGRTLRDNIFRGSTNVPLSDTGWLQMTEAVGNKPWDRIVSSPLDRCRKFAATLAEQNRIELETDERLREYDFGDWDGKNYDEVMNVDAGLVKQFFADPFSHRPPNGEPFAEFTKRVLQGWRELSGNVAAGNTLVISHGGVIMTILADVLGVDRLHGRIEMPYACRSRIRLDQAGQRLVGHG